MINKNVIEVYGVLSSVGVVDYKEKDDVKMASKWRGISIHEHSTALFTSSLTEIKSLYCVKNKWTKALLAGNIDFFQVN